MDNIKMEVTLNSLLKHGVLGQQRTSRHKKYTIIQVVSNQGSEVVLGAEVYKGPYAPSDAQTIWNRYQQLLAWKATCLNPPIRQVPTSDGVFLVYSNLIQGAQVQVSWHQEAPNMGSAYWIIQRSSSSLDKFNHLILQNPWVYQRYAEELVYTLSLMFILNIGDTGVANILIDTQKQAVYIIDLDEQRSGTIKDPKVFYFSMPPSEKYRWYENVSSTYAAVAQRIERALREMSDQRCYRSEAEILDRSEAEGGNPTVREGTSERNEVTRREGNPTRQERMSEYTQVTFQVLQLLYKYGTGSHYLNNPEFLAGPNLEESMAALSLNPPTPMLVETDQTIPTGTGMRWNGIHSTTTTTNSGYTADIVKSGLQKYIRRGIVNKALLCAVELYRMGEVGGDPLVTNLYNRLAIISAEDIGMANLPLVSKVLQVVRERNRQPVMLASLVHALADSKKTRLSSHLWRAYATPEGAALARTQGITVPLNDNPNPLQEYSAALDRKEFTALTWAHYFLENNPKGKIPSTYRESGLPINGKYATKRTTVIGYALWQALFERVKADQRQLLIDLCDTWYEVSEKRPFLVLGILVILYDAPSDNFNLQPYLDYWSNEGATFLAELLSGVYKLTIDSFVVDQHTREGRNQGKDARDFVSEGALVENQDTRYYIPLFAEIYEER